MAAYLRDAREMHLCQSLYLHIVHAVDIRGTSEDVFRGKVLHTTFGHHISLYVTSLRVFESLHYGKSLVMCDMLYWLVLFPYLLTMVQLIGVINT